MSAQIKAKLNPYIDTLLTRMTWFIFFSASESLFVNSDDTLFTSSVSASLSSSNC